MIKISFLGTTSFLVLCPLFIGLGIWQLDYAQQKQQEKKDYQEYSRSPALLINDAEQIKILKQGQRVKIKGQYLNELHVLLDEQYLQGQAGYVVFSPFQIENSNSIIWVNRGWLAIDVNQIIPSLTAETTPQTLMGVLTQPPAPTQQLTNNTSKQYSTQLLQVQALDYQQLSQTLQRATPPYVLLLLTPQEERFQRFPDSYDTTPNKYYAYAYQWFAFAFALSFLYILFGITHRVTARKTNQ
ncbi:SURF1 family protein [Beggiatoa leptomitoformis]|uniref:SURF1-like protein n=1 Tax=Beggiatoa leptomitoformis TaxID=288004 RepID=A0A2N9YCM8_9GAMM|nr:SURF1 family protein [Beggiatoa leptomitoformis]ALG66491.1 hypothetical protein AL038_00490 [Beggiatoa leptomitoformis]AUI68217.1 hypothetical protein BLE401_05555 [Beggiatoa leptomitoformis]